MAAHDAYGIFILPEMQKLWKSFKIRSSKSAFPKIEEWGLQLQATAVDEDEKGGYEKSSRPIYFLSLMCYNLINSDLNS